MQYICPGPAMFTTGGCAHVRVNALLWQKWETTLLHTYCDFDQLSVSIVGQIALKVIPTILSTTVIVVVWALPSSPLVFHGIGILHIKAVFQPCISSENLTHMARRQDR